MHIADCIELYLEGLSAGGAGSGCQGPNCGRPKVGTTPDHTGKIPVHPDVAKEGAGLAESLGSASNRYDSANRESTAVMYNKSNQLRRGPKAAKEIAEANKKKEAASKAYRDEASKSAVFEKQNGIHPVQAWEAHHDRDWPGYRVNSSGQGRKYYVAKG
jgi:hypothetical protein